MFGSAYAHIVTKRHQPFVLDISVPNLDLTGKAATFEVRSNPEADPPLIALELAAAEQDGIVATRTQTEDGIPTTRFVITIGKATVEGLPIARPIGANLETFYGFKLDGFELFGGPLTWEAQANHA